MSIMRYPIIYNERIKKINDNKLKLLTLFSFENKQPEID